MFKNVIYHPDESQVVYTTFSSIRDHGDHVAHEGRETEKEKSVSLVVEIDEPQKEDL